jgi:hypothetical protein
MKYKQLKIFDTLINQQTVNGHLWKDPYFIYSTNYIIDSIHKKFYSYNFFKKLENSRKPTIPEVRIAI